jgi:hypothetical protein
MTIQYKVDLSAKFGQARHQGRRGTCTVFAASDVNRVVSGATADLSPEFLYMSAGMLMPNWKVGEGIFPWAAMDAIRKPGQPLETDYPYQATHPAVAAAPVTAGGVAMYCSDLGGHSEVMQDVLDRLNDGHPVGLVIRVTNGFYTPMADGVVDAKAGILPNSTHVVVATGWGDSSASGRHVRIRNSWGTGWGQQGYAWLPEKFVDLHVIEAFGRK